jgi:hypothetical protein
MMAISRVFACNFFRAALAASLALALGSCSALGSKTDKDGPEVLRYEYRPSLGFVRIERIESGAPDNAHPFGISIDAMRQKLASVKLKGDPIFTSEELDEVVPYLAAALKSVGSNEDVTFAITGSHGLLGKFSPKTVTTGRVFVIDQRLNIIFGVVHDPFGILQMQTPNVPQPFIPGTRAKRIDTRLAITPGKGRLAADDRPDWVTFDAARTE